MAAKGNRLKNEPKSEKKKEEKSSVSFVSRFQSISDFLRNEKTHQISGLFLMLLSAYLFIALTSFLFTWTTDQDKFNDISVFQFLFRKGITVDNWLGKIGALISHLFIHRWFGVASFFIVPVLFLTGYRILFRVSPLPLGKVYRTVFFALIWFSCAFAYIFTDSNYFLGGGFGYHVNEWMYALVGYIGMGLLIGAAMLTFLFLTFNFSLIPKPKVEAESLIDDSAVAENILRTPSDKLEMEIEGEEILPVSEVPEEQVMESILPGASEIFEKPAKEKEETELEIEPQKETVPEPDLSFTIEAPAEEASVTGETERMPLGEYDPTLDLSSYKFPTLDLLEQYGSNKILVNKEELEANKNKIVETLGHYNIEIDKIKAIIGPTVTLYEIIPAAGVRISKIKNLEDDIALSLAALGIRIIAPIPGKGTIGIEVPNQKPEIVSMHAVLSSEKFQNTDFDLPIALGKTISNEVFIADLAKMPHLLMAGATGQGKSVGLNAILVSLLYKKHPSQIKFVLVDPKKVELTLFRKIERHFLAKLPGEEDAIITDTTKVIHTLNSLCIEMGLRYDLLKDAEVRNLKEYNAKFISRKLNPNNGHRFLPFIVVVVDEFADLIMTAGKEVETPMARLAQLARAIGIHLILATQRPSVNIITGTIKANFPARIAFRVISKIDSRTILDSGGAEQLIGRGDMLLSTGAELIRIQCGFVDTPEVEKITAFIGEQRGYPEAHKLPEYVDDKAEGGAGELNDEDRDALFEDAARMVVQHQQGSASLLQRRLKLGYNRAGRIIDQLEAAGIIGPFEGSKAREVLVKDPVALDQMFAKSKEE